MYRRLWPALLAGVALTWSPSWAEEVQAADQTPAGPKRLLPPLAHPPGGTFTVFPGGFITLSPGGRMVAIATSEETVLVRQARSGKEIRQLKGDRVTGPIAYSPDGKILAGASHTSNSITLWAVATGEKIGQLDGIVGPMTFSPDGKTLAATCAPDVRMWEVATGNLLRQFDPAWGPRPLAFSPDGKSLATVRWEASAAGVYSVKASTVTVWDIASGKELQRWDVPARVVGSLAFSADGRMLAAGNSLMHYTGKEPIGFHLWDVRSGDDIRQVTWGHASGLECCPRVAFYADGKTLATLDGQQLLLWEVLSGKERRCIRNTDEKLLILLSPDGNNVGWVAKADWLKAHWWASPLSFSPVLNEQAVLRGSDRQLEECWSHLASADAARAFQSVCTLAARAEQSVPLLRSRVRPAPIVPAPVAQLVKDLDHDQFPVRQQAAEQLEKLGEAAVPALRKVLEGNPSLEVRRRAEGLLEKVRQNPLTPERLRSLRAIEVLERAGTPEAQKALAGLAEGLPEADLTREAKAALGRLARMPNALP